MAKSARYSSGMDFGVAAKICPQNFARVLVLEKFINELNKIEDIPVELKIGVLGGGSDEPEIQALRATNRKVSVKTVGLDDSDIYMNLEYLYHDDSFEKFDLILCSQVLEHVWNHNNFFINLRSLVGHGGLVWLAAPATNHPHGSPDFYSPGFTHSYLKQNLENNKFQVFSSGSVGSKRLYYGTTSLARWLTVAEHQSPLTEIIKPSNIFKNLYHKNRIFHLMLLKFLSPKVSCDTRFVTESWALAVNQVEF